MRLIRDEEKMTAKERVKKTFAHQIPDRIPINYSANPGIDSRLKDYFNIDRNDNEKLLDVLGVDFRGVSAPYIGPILHSPIESRRVDPLWGIHTRWIEHESGGYWDYCDFPLKDADLDDIENWLMPSPDDYNYSVLPDLCSKNQQYAIYIGNPGLGDIINSSGMIRGMEQTLIDLVSDDPIGLRFIDRRLDIQFEVTRRSLEAADGKIDFLWMGEDLGTQIGPMISKSLFRKHILPRHQRFIKLAQAYDLPVMLHSCGSSSWSFPDYIDAGLRAVDTLQPEAKYMEPSYLKNNFGDDLVFHGCISTAGPVAFGTVDQVIENVKETLDIMMDGGGYCFSPTHSLQDNSPVQNVIAMYEAAHHYGRYK